MKSMTPEQALGCSVAVVLGFNALTLLAMAGPVPVIIWFLVCLPMWWAVLMVVVFGRRETPGREWE